MKRLQQSKRALGSEVILTLVVPADIDHEHIFKDMWGVLEKFENRFSRFKEASELSQFNLHAGELIPVSEEFHELLKAVQYYTTATRGLFNPFILPGLQQSGYKGSWPNPSEHNENLDFSDRTVAAIDALGLTTNTAQIPKSSALDLGGIGKGYALDRLASLLNENNVSNFWLSLGGDIMCKGVDVDGRHWKVAVASYSDPERTVATVEAMSNDLLSIATSGITKRRGANWHHIIDPRSGKPSTSNVVTATVLSKSGITADIYAKCLVIDPAISLPSTILGVVVQAKDKMPHITQTGGIIHAEFV